MVLYSDAAVRAHGVRAQEEAEGGGRAGSAQGTVPAQGAPRDGGQEGRGGPLLPDLRSASEMILGRTVPTDTMPRS